MSTALPVSAVDLFVRQIDLDELHDVGRAAMQAAFGHFIAPTMTEDEERQRQEQIESALGGVDLGSRVVGDRGPFRRRFAGGGTLSRGCYHSIARDAKGGDDGTLLHELLAYYQPTEPGWVGVFDLALPEHREAVLSRLASLSKAERERLDLGDPGMVISFHGLGGRPHPFAARHTDRAVPFLVAIPTVHRRLRVERVVDLRSPEVASWFTREMTAWREDVDGRELDLIPAKRPLQEFRDLIPTLLEQSLGSESRALSNSAGLRLRRRGVNGLVFPSARTDCVLEIDRGRVVRSVGWNFVDYRGSDVSEMDFIVDIDTEWPTNVGWPQMAYEDVRIEYCERGPSRGSWSVSGLATWQGAWFRARAVLSVLEAKDRGLFDEVAASLQSLWQQAKSGDQLLQTSDVVFGALLGSEKELEAIRDWARAFDSAGNPELAATFRKIAAAAR